MITLFLIGLLLRPPTAVCVDGLVAPVVYKLPSERPSGTVAYLWKPRGLYVAVGKEWKLIPRGSYTVRRYRFPCRKL